MIKKILLTCLLTALVANRPVKPVDLDDTAFYTALAALAVKIISEAVAIEQLNKTTPKAVGIQAGADAASNVATIAGLTVPLQLFIDCFKDGNNGYIFKDWEYLKKFTFTRSYDNGDKKDLPGYEIVDKYVGDNYLANGHIGQGNVKFTNETVPLGMLATMFGTLKLEAVIKHLLQNKAMYKNRKAIAKYRKDPQVQEFLTKQKSKQRRWVAENWLIPSAICAVLFFGGDYIKNSLEHKYDNFLDNAGIATGIISILAGYVSEQFRAAQFNKLAMASKDNPLEIPEEKADADEEKSGTDGVSPEDSAATEAL